MTEDRSMNHGDEIKEEALTFLKKNNTAVVATVFEGEAYASTVHYTINEDWSIHFLAHRNTAKYLNISSLQRGAIVVGTGPKHISLQARGILDICVGKERDKIIKEFEWLKGSHIIEHWPIEEMAKFEDKDPVTFKFEPLEAVFMNLDDDKYPKSKGKEYHKII